MLTRETELAILYEISSISMRLRDVEGIGDVALDKATRLLGAEVAIFYLYEPESSQLSARAARGLRLGKVRTTISISTEHPLLGGPLVWCMDDAVPFPIDPLDGVYLAQSAIGLPIRSEVELLGWLYVAWLRPHPIEHGESTLYTILADRIGSALEITLARERDRQQREALVAANQRLEHTLAELTRAHEQQMALVETVRELSIPGLVIADQIILMPLIGNIDIDRSSLLTERMLQAVAAQQARICIIDVTGVSVVDTVVANILLHAATAVRLLGAQVVLCGIRPEVAQVVVSLGVELNVLTPASDLRGALQIAFRKLGKEIVDRQRRGEAQ